MNMSTKVIYRDNGSARVTSYRAMLRFVAVFGGYIVQESDSPVECHNVIFGDVVVGYFRPLEYKPC